MLIEFIRYIAAGTATTLAVTLVALPLGLVIGLIFALLHVYGGRVLMQLMRLYSTLMRGMPPILLLFILYFIIQVLLTYHRFGRVRLHWV